MIKFLRILFPAILVIAMIGCAKDEQEPDPKKPPRPPVEELGEWLETLPGVESVEELESPDFKKYYLVVFEQLLDPKNPSAGTFSQRVFLAHRDFDSPMIFETEGYNAQRSVKNARQSELTRHYNANCVVVEHRYSGLSLPEELDWKYLTCENAAGDLHAVRKALGVAYTGSWIATGASKGGTNAMSYTMYYPDDVAATVAYVGPICNSTNDTRFIDHMLNVATPEMRKKIVDFQREVLIRRDRIQPIFFPESSESFASNVVKEKMTKDQLYEMVLVNYAHKVWQREMSIDEIPKASATDEEIIDYLRDIELFGASRSSVSGEEEYPEDISIVDYLRLLKNHSTRVRGTPVLSKVHYYVQTLIELGSYSNTIKPLEDLIPNHKSWSVNMIARFYVPTDAANIQFSDKLYRQMNQWLQNNDPRLICVYGEYDPWTAAAPDKAYFAGKSNMAIFVKKAGAHNSKIEGLAPTEKDQAWIKLDGWVKK